jgi:formamidopyrimidine-DNA glycosylase
MPEGDNLHRAAQSLGSHASASAGRNVVAELRTQTHMVMVHDAPIARLIRRAEPRYDCGTPIALVRQGDARRSTYFCPNCQPARSL